MTDTLPEAHSKSGLILKAAREEMSLTLEQVANELHLRPTVVKAIEDDNYDEFSSDVFLKGYFRTYCRLVNLHESRMMELLEQQLNTRHKQAEQIRLLASKELSAKKRKKLFITFAFFIALLALVAFVYQLTNKSVTNDIVDIQKSNEVGSLALEDTPILPSVASRPESIKSVDAKTQVPDQNPTPIQKAEPVSPSDNALTTLNTESMPSFSQDDSNDDLGNDAIDTIEIEKTDSLYVLNASFTGDCWFKVTDSNGRTVIAALKKLDDEVHFEGSAPFHIVIGDASKVSLSFQNDEVNLKPYTSRNGRAELTLSPSDTDREG